MMLWDIIRDWFVQYIFGGTLSNGDIVNGNLGSFMFQGFSDGGLDTSSLYLPLNASSLDGNIIGVSLGDWLSTTATIIMVVLLLIMLLSLVRFVIRQVCGLFAKI